MRQQNGTSREGKIGHLGLHARRANHLITPGFSCMLCINKRMLFVLCFLNLSSSLHFYSPLIQLTCIDSPHSDSGIRKILLVQSGIRENIACRIRNPGLWNPEYRVQRIRNLTNDWNPQSKFQWQKLKSSTWNPESTGWNPESKTVLDSLTKGVCASLRSRKFSR